MRATATLLEQRLRGGPEAADPVTILLWCYGPLMLRKVIE
jgi:hypothetical protein